MIFPRDGFDAETLDFKMAWVLDTAWEKAELTLTNKDADLSAQRTLMGIRIMAERDPERLKELALQAIAYGSL